MTQQQFNEACMYANSQLEEWQIEQALEIMNKWRCSLDMASPSASDTITDAMDEWCRDHDLDQDEWLEWGCEEDVFFNVN